MKVELKKVHLSEAKENLLCVFLMQDEEPPYDIRRFLHDVKKQRYEGKLLQTFATDTRGEAKFRHLLVVGLGRKEEFRMDNLRRAAGAAARYAAARKEAEFAMHLPANFIARHEHLGMVQAMTEGAILAAYRFNEYKTKKEDLFSVESARIVSEEDIGEGIRLGTIYAEAQNYSRRLDEQPANIATPRMVADEARRLARECGLGVSVHGTDWLRRKNMNGILSVSQGSVHPPLLVRLEYNRGKRYPLYCIVGKGVCFDSGGISIKPSANMHEMKYDKSGAINVLGVFKAVAELKIPIRLVGLMPMVENMPSGSAQKPGDIITAYNGKTIEVLNTDAEGRLILADALALGAEEKPECLIDMATLTGAMVVSLGRHAIGMFSNDDELSDALKEAGEAAHERVWRMPLWPEYGEMMKSDLADMKNISEVPEAGSITAAAFLAEFAGETRWAHLDIAAVDMVKGPHPYLDKGATGIGVRLVASALARLAKKR
ncbi:leucyl aminopeptidase [Candidatus Micrarchaeota archaeon]|nr:leucyl aminopeptidase [Candidatus Micrarchaeota archaeon]